MSNPSPVIRVLLVDDHEVIRRGLSVSLLAFDDIEVVGEAATGVEAVRLCAELQPDVILMDLMMPEMNGVEAAEAICRRHPQTQIIALTSYKEEALVESVLKAGAIGYLLKNVSLDELAGAIRAAKAGRPTLGPEATQALIASVTKSPPPGQDLTRSEEHTV